MSTASRDPARNPIEAIALRVLEPILRYLRSYPATVVMQRDDGSVDLRIINRSTPLPDPSAVPLRGLPGVSLRVKQGATVLLEFELHPLAKKNEERFRPIATLFTPDSLDSIAISASTSATVDGALVNIGANAARAVALDGDIGIVNGFTPAGVPFTGTFQIIASARKARAE